MKERYLIFLKLIMGKKNLILLNLLLKVTGFFPTFSSYFQYKRALSLLSKGETPNADMYSHDYLTISSV